MIEPKSPALFLLLAGALLVGASVPSPSVVGERREATAPYLQANKQPSTDLHGDLLPPGAVARLGTARLFHEGGYHVAYSNDGKILASSGSGKIVLWDAASGRELRRFPGNRGFALSPDGKLLASSKNMGSKQVAVQIWDTATGKELRQLPGHSAEVFTLAFSLNSKLLATGSFDGTLRLWDAVRGTQTALLTEKAGRILALAFSPDGRTLISGEDKMSRIWEIVSCKERQRFSDLVFKTLSSNGQIMAMTSDKDHALHLVHVNMGKSLLTLKDFPSDSKNIAADLNGMSFSPDGKTIATACRRDAAIRLWDAASGKAVRAMPLGGYAFSVAFAPDGKTMAAGVSWAAYDLYRIRLFDPANGAERFLQPGHQGTITGVRFLENDKRVASTGADKTFLLWQAGDGKAIRVVPLTKIPLAMSPDGSLVAAGGIGGASAPLDETLDIWDTSTGKIKHQLAGHSGGVRNAAFSADGGMVAVTTIFGIDLVIWDTATGKIRNQWALPRGSAGQATVALAFSPDGKIVATGNRGRMVSLWDVGTGVLLREFGKPLDSDQERRGSLVSGVSTIAFSPDSKSVAAGLFPQGAAYLWDVASGKEVRRFQYPFEKDTGNGLVFSLDGKTLFGCGIGVVSMWDTASGKDRTFEVPTRSIRALAVSADGTRLAIGWEECILIWAVDKANR